MPTNTEFPLSYMPQPNAESDRSTAMRDLLASLESTTVPQPQQPRVWRRILGALGDALGAAAAAKAGGIPPAIGPFAANMRQRQAQYEQESQAAARANIDLRNRVRIGAFQESERLKREKEVATIRLAAGKRLLKSEFTRDVNGEPHTFQRWQDPQTGEVMPVPEPQTGELVYERDLGPRGYATTTLATPEGYVRTPRSGGPATPITYKGGRPVMPQPPAGIVTSIAQEKATLGGLDDLWGAYQTVREETAGRGDLLDAMRQRAGTFVGETRMGGALAPEYANYVASRRAALNAYIKAQTGAQFSVKELARYETQYPEPWDSPELARKKLDVLRDRVLTDMQAKLRAFPAAGGPPSPKAAEPTNDPARDLFRKMFGRDPEAP